MKQVYWIFSFLSAILLIIAFPRMNIAMCAWFAFVPLFYILKGRKPFFGFLLSYVCGFVFFAGILYWLTYVTYLGYILLVLYLALYFGVFGFLVCIIHPFKHNGYRFWSIPCIWVLLEYIRTHLFTGFGWAFLGYSQYLNLPVIQIAHITGIWGVSFLVMTCNAFIYNIIENQLRVRIYISRGTFINYALPCFLLIGVLSYGYIRINTQGVPRQEKPFVISVVQGNIPQEMKWRKEAQTGIINTYLDLSRQCIIEHPDLIVWPEAALPEILNSELDLHKDIRSFLYAQNIPLLLGAVRMEGEDYYNSALFVSHHGQMVQRYDKLHLVPFGEYIPLKRTLPFLQTIVPIGDFSPGETYTLFPLNRTSYNSPAITQKIPRSEVDFGVLVCFEDVFPSLSRRFVLKGADFLINITNDAWFGNTSSPYQHLQASVFRAVENGVYVVRCANTGISCFITPHGKTEVLKDVMRNSAVFFRGCLTRHIPISPEAGTFYTHWGDWFIMLCVCIVVCVLLYKRKEYSSK